MPDLERNLARCAVKASHTALAPARTGQTQRLGSGMRRAFDFTARTIAALAALSLCAGGLAAGPAAVSGETMRQADAAAHAGDWQSYSRTWDEQRFSPLDQINDRNVQQLGLAWYDDLETMRGVQASPLVIDGVLYNV